MKNNKNRESDAEGAGSGIENQIEDQIDGLFKLPLAEFTGARNDLAARLKRDGHANHASLVKALAKPSVTAWAVNQLYWNHHEAFDRVLAAGQRFRQAQASGTLGKAADTRESLAARSEALSHLTELAASSLRDAGHNPTPDTIHRIATTLEAVSAYASLPAGATAGRFARDVDPPGFEALASMIPITPAPPSPESAAAARHTGKTTSPANDVLTPESGSAPSDPVQEVFPPADLQKARLLEEASRARIAAAEVSLDAAKTSLSDATARAERLEAAQNQADAAANQAEKELRESEELLKKARSASQEAAQRSQTIAAEAKEAAKALEDSKRNVEKALQELQSLIKES